MSKRDRLEGFIVVASFAAWLLLMMQAMVS